LPSVLALRKPEQLTALERSATTKTRGRPDIAFASGAYDPISDAGKRLIAHELVHVVQQSGPQGSHPPVEAEQEAAQLGQAAADGGRVVPALATPVRTARQTVRRRRPA
jgi:hypothetical protein